MADLVGAAVAVGTADLLAHVLDAKLVGEAVGVCAADRLAKLGVALIQKIRLEILIIFSVTR